MIIGVSCSDVWEERRLSLFVEAVWREQKELEEKGQVALDKSLSKWLVF